MAKYKFTGDHEKHFPVLGKLVKPGEIIETDQPVNHPELEVVKDEVKKKETKI